MVEPFGQMEPWSDTLLVHRIVPTWHSSAAEEEEAEEEEGEEDGRQQVVIMLSRLPSHFVSPSE